MPLEWPANPQAEIIDETDFWVFRFALYDHKTLQVMCRVTRQALLDRAGRDNRREERARETLDRCRNEIVEIASAKYDAGEEEPIVTNNDL